MEEHIGYLLHFSITLSGVTCKSTHASTQIGHMLSKQKNKYVLILFKNNIDSLCDI